MLRVGLAHTTGVVAACVGFAQPRYSSGDCDRPSSFSKIMVERHERRRARRRAVTSTIRMGGGIETHSWKRLPTRSTGIRISEYKRTRGSITLHTGHRRPGRGETSTRETTAKQKDEKHDHHDSRGQGGRETKQPLSWRPPRHHSHYSNACAHNLSGADSAIARLPSFIGMRTRPGAA